MGRDGKRWEEMGRDGKRWEEMGRDGKGRTEEKKKGKKLKKDLAHVTEILENWQSKPSIQQATPALSRVERLCVQFFCVLLGAERTSCCNDPSHIDRQRRCVG